LLGGHVRILISAWGMNDEIIYEIYHILNGGCEIKWAMILAARVGFKPGKIRNFSSFHTQFITARTIAHFKINLFSTLVPFYSGPMRAWIICSCWRHQILYQRQHLWLRMFLQLLQWVLKGRLLQTSLWKEYNHFIWLLDRKWNTMWM